MEVQMCGMGLFVQALAFVSILAKHYLMYSCSTVSVCEQLVVTTNECV
jgi:hypothetical protein